MDHFFSSSWVALFFFPPSHVKPTFIQLPPFGHVGVSGPTLSTCGSTYGQGAAPLIGFVSRFFPLVSSAVPDFVSSLPLHRDHRFACVIVSTPGLCSGEKAGSNPSFTGFCVQIFHGFFPRSPLRISFPARELSCTMSNCLVLRTLPRKPYVLMFLFLLFFSPPVRFVQLAEVLSLFSAVPG